MVENCSIRNFSPDDLPQLHAIREAAYRPVFQSFRDILGAQIAPTALASAEREQADYLETLCSPESDRDVYVVERDGEIVAFCVVALDHKTKVGEIDLNAVDPEHQGKGIGTWLYAYALDCMKNAEMKVATVGTGGDPSHAPARRAYEKAGFGPSIPSVYLYRSL